MASMTATELDRLALETCHREPIHIPGSIQPHGMLLALEMPGLVVDRASANVEEWVGKPAAAILGRPVEEALGVDLGGRLRAALADGSIERSPVALAGARAILPGGPRSFEAIAHRSGPSMVVVELEPAAGDEATPPDRLHARVRAALSRLEGEPSLDDVCRAAAVEVRRITGVDRVLIYRFNEEWDGTVVAEDGNGALASYLGQKFPANDIPEQARALYRASRLRLIPDADYEPVPLVGRPGRDAPLDLSQSTLRSVSPVHVEYMRNMGTGASMSISILRNGELWGLISCHNREPHLVPFEVRTACDLLGRVLSIQVDAWERRSELEHRIGRQAAVARLLIEMAEGDDFVQGLVRRPEVLLDVTRAAGAAIYHEGDCFKVGATPAQPELEAIADWLATEDRGAVFSTDMLARQMPGAAAEAIKDAASGVLAVPISQLHRSMILWFRPEVLKTETWGGDPRKAAPAADGRIHPRSSFAAWRETVRLRAEPWRPAEVEAADDLRKAILGVVLRRAEERAQLTAELERSNQELEAFSYSVSHDLRAPFRHILGYAELLGEEEDARLSPEGRRYLGTIIESAQFAGALVDNLLAFSQMGRTTIIPTPIAMDALFREAIRAAQAELELAGRAVEWRLGPLPEVEGDVMMLRQVVTNLISNAVKYTRTRDRAVITVEGSTQGREAVFAVGDNGIGFDMSHVDKLFGVFQRLHRMEEFEGTGIGLANVRRIVNAARRPGLGRGRGRPRARPSGSPCRSRRKAVPPTRPARGGA